MVVPSPPATERDDVMIRKHIRTYNPNKNTSQKTIPSSPFMLQNTTITIVEEMDKANDASYRKSKEKRVKSNIRPVQQGHRDCKRTALLENAFSRSCEDHCCSVLANEANEVTRASST